MKIKNTDSLVVVATAGIFIIWLALTGLFLWGFAEELWLKIVITTIGATVFEALHLWSMIKMKTYWKDSSKAKKIPYVAMFLIVASFTIFAAISFAGKVVSSHQNKVKDQSYELVQTLKKIDQCDANISIYQSRINAFALSTNSSDKATYNRANKDLAVAISLKSELEEIYKNLKADTNTVEKKEAVSAFEFYSNTTKLPIELIVIVLMALFFVGLEFGYVLTAPIEEKSADVFLNYKESILKYIDELMNIEDGKKRLKNNKDISTATGLSLTECKSFEGMLSGKDTENAITFRSPSGAKTPLIEIGQGKRRANFSKEDMKKIVNAKLATM